MKETISSRSTTVTNNTILKEFIEIHDKDGCAMMVKANRIAAFWNKRVSFENGEVIYCIESYEEIKEKMARALEK